MAGYLLIIQPQMGRRLGLAIIINPLLARWLGKMAIFLKRSSRFPSIQILVVDSERCVELSQTMGGAKLGAWHVGAIIQGELDFSGVPGGGIEPHAFNYHFAEGRTFEIPVARSYGGRGAVSVDYQILGCENLIDPATSSPAFGTIEWADGDQSDAILTLDFIDDGQFGDATGQACLKVVLNPPQREKVLQSDRTDSPRLQCVGQRLPR